MMVPVTKMDPRVALRQAVKRKYALSDEDIVGLEIRKKSLDARKKSSIKFIYQLDLEVQDEAGFLRAQKDLDPSPPLKTANLYDGIDRPKFRHPPVIIGSGPAGSFAALVLAGMDIPCVVVERGEPVEDRLRTASGLKRGKFKKESNFCYGEGGAGTFSDGKLTCGRNHPLVREVFRRFVEFGAPKEILYDAHPHMGTDFLLKIAKNQRSYLQSQGCTFRFNERFDGFQSGGAHARFKLQLSSGDTLDTDHVILATGHSARETYEMLYDNGVAIEPKPFAIGARFEHPQAAIDRIQFGQCQLLPPAEYKLAAKVENRGIWTFCMCPGGFLLPTGADEGHLAINGMSYHARSSGFANAAVVVNVKREDFYQGHPLDGIKFQAQLEREAFMAGGGGYHAPGQRLVDFLAGRKSTGELKSTYKPGVTPARMDQLLPEFVVESLKGALDGYNRKMKGFICDDAMVVGLESKTSAPVCLPRDPSLQSHSHPGLFPCGEGAGYAGGIVSAALDGLKVGQAVLRSMV